MSSMLYCCFSEKIYKHTGRIVKNGGGEMLYLSNFINKSLLIL